MSNYQKFEYEKMPGTENSDFKIFPLSITGLQQYTSKDSYPRKYLEKLTPEILKKFEMEEKGKEKEKKELERLELENGRFYGKKRSTKPNLNNLEDCNDKIPEEIRKGFLINDIDERELNLNSSNFSSKKNKNNYELGKININQSHNFLSKFMSKFDNPYMKSVLGKEKFEYTRNIPLKNQYHQINNLRSNKFSTESLKKSGGLESFNIPRIGNQILVKSDYSNKMINSLKASNSTSFFNKLSNYSDLNQLCNQENQKLSKNTKLETNLMKSTSPVIKSYLNYGKNMGARYNPHSFNQSNPSNFKRNIHGGKFEN